MKSSLLCSAMTPCGKKTWKEEESRYIRAKCFVLAKADGQGLWTNNPEKSSEVPSFWEVFSSGSPGQGLCGSLPRQLLLRPRRRYGFASPHCCGWNHLSCLTFAVAKVSQKHLYFKKNQHHPLDLHRCKWGEQGPTWCMRFLISSHSAKVVTCTSKQEADGQESHNHQSKTPTM